MDSLAIKCQELICIPAGLGFQQHILVGPENGALVAINAAITADKAVKLEVTDYDGDSTSRRLHVPIGVKKTGAGTLILTTREL
jgi:hypothetical protein